MSGDSGGRSWRGTVLVVLALVLLVMATAVGVDPGQHMLRVAGQVTRVVVALALLVIATARPPGG